MINELIPELFFSHLTKQLNLGKSENHRKLQGVPQKMSVNETEERIFFGIPCSVGKSKTILTIKYSQGLPVKAKKMKALQNCF